MAETSLIRTPILSDQGPTRTASCSIIHSCEGPAPKYSRSAGWGFNTGKWGCHAVHSRVGSTPLTPGVGLAAGLYQLCLQEPRFNLDYVEPKSRRPLVT